MIFLYSYPNAHLAQVEISKLQKKKKKNSKMKKRKKSKKKFQKYKIDIIMKLRQWSLGLKIIEMRY